jgi:hypothetical protein
MANTTSAAPSRALPPLPPADTLEQVDSNHSSRSSSSLRRKPVPNVAQYPPIPSFNIDEHEDAVAGGRDSRLSGSSLSPSSAGHSRTPSRETPDITRNRDSGNSIPVTKDIPIRQLHISDGSYRSRYSHAAEMDVTNFHDTRRAILFAPPEPTRNNLHMKTVVAMRTTMGLTVRFKYPAVPFPDPVQHILWVRN